MVQGKVILSFVIEKDGVLSDVVVLHSVSKNIDDEAVRVLKLSRKWEPAFCYGRPVRVRYSIPISFTLQ
jgi:protein TonB